VNVNVIHLNQASAAVHQEEAAIVRRPARHLPRRQGADTLPSVPEVWALSSCPRPLGARKRREKKERKKRKKKKKEKKRKKERKRKELI
jgi:hypothetical protein